MKRLLFITAIALSFVSCKKNNNELLQNDSGKTTDINAGIGPAPDYEWRALSIPPEKTFGNNGQGIIMQANGETFFAADGWPNYKLNNNTKQWEALGHEFDFFGSFSTGLQYFFSYQSKIYCGMNRDGNTTGSSCISWDVITHISTAIAAFPGTPVSDPTCFVIGTKGYITGGYNNQNGSLVNQLWEYNFLTNQWINKGSSPLGERAGSIAMVVDNKAYIGMGYGYINLNGQQITQYKNDWVLYDPASVYSIIKTAFPGQKRACPRGFVLSNAPYVGFGTSGSSYYKDFWKYNPAADTWTQQQNWPGTDIHGWYHALGTFSLGNTGYMVKGNLGEFWKFSNSPFAMQ